MSNRPPQKDRSRWLSFGPYVGMTGDPKMDQRKVASDLYKSAANATSFHGMSPWTNQGFYWCNFDKTRKRFDVLSRNDEWFEWLYNWCCNLWYCWIGLEYAFFDVYFEDKWEKYRTGEFPYFPFVHNNVGINWGGSAKPLYDSWLPGPGGGTYAWLQWREKHPHEFEWLEPKPNTIGYAIQKVYIAGVIDVFKRVRDANPGFNLRIKPFNECRAWCEGWDGAKPIMDNSRCLGDREEIKLWLREQFVAAGLIKGGTTKFYDDMMMVDSSGLDRENDLYVIAQKSTAKVLKGYQMEVHNISGVAEVESMRDAGFKPEDALESTDGESVTANDAYFVMAQSLIDKGYPQLDIKVDGWKGFKWDKKNMQSNWDRLIPRWQKLKERPISG